jgi:hypothetical protein
VNTELAKVGKEVADELARVNEAVALAATEAASTDLLAGMSDEEIFELELDVAAQRLSLAEQVTSLATVNAARVAAYEAVQAEIIARHAAFVAIELAVVCSARASYSSKIAESLVVQSSERARRASSSFAIAAAKTAVREANVNSFIP